MANNNLSSVLIVFKIKISYYKMKFFLTHLLALFSKGIDTFSNMYPTSSISSDTGLKIISDFSKFVNKYDKSYDNIGKMESAFYNYVNTVDMISSHNVDTSGYSIGITQFADMSAEEFNQFKGPGCLSTKSTSSCGKFSPSSKSVPDSIDWTSKGGVTDVKNQGQCGSCWSFSATGAMEGAWFVSTGDLVSLSEQQLMDCSTRYGNMGCNGGLMDGAFEYAIDKGGMCSEEEVPYQGVDGTCSDCTPVVKFSGCTDVTPNNQLHLKEAVSNGPVSIAIEADTSVFQHYTGGVISSASCGTNLDHGVLVVGYGTDGDGTMWWLVKNSWGNTWGDNGYVKISRTESENDKGVCGIAMQPSYPIC